MSQQSLPRPKRIQRSRAGGWKMPANAVYVGRPTKWGNPFMVGTLSHDDPPQSLTAEEAVALYEEQIDEILEMADASLEELRGKDLVCWCPLNKPCHADVLLRLANRLTDERVKQIIGELGFEQYQ